MNSSNENYMLLNDCPAASNGSMTSKDLARHGADSKAERKLNPEICKALAHQKLLDMDDHDNLLCDSTTT